MAPDDDDKDLIYEGIATLPMSPRSVQEMLRDDKDLIYEGIATSGGATALSSAAMLDDDDKDLIYEGIATRRKSNDLQGLGRQRPDLRRDCDLTFQWKLPHEKILTTKT